MQVQAHDIGHLFQELRIARELKSLRAMRLKIVCAPDIVDGRLANALALRHRPATLMCHPCRFGLQGRIHDTGDLVYLISGLSSAPRSDVPQTVQALVTEPLSPQNHGVSIHRKPFRNCDIGLSRRPERYGNAKPPAAACRAPKSTAGGSAAPPRKSDTTSPLLRPTRTGSFSSVIC